MFTAAEEQQAQKKSRLPLAIAAAVIVLALLGGGGYMMYGRSKAKPVTKPVTAAVVPTATAPRVISEPIVASASPTSTAATATTGSADPEAQKKAFEEAVRQRMQAEMMKLQNDFMAELKQTQSKNAPVVSAPVVPVSAPAKTETIAEERPAVTAAQLDAARRLEQQQVAETRVPAPAPAQTTQTTQTMPAAQPAAPVPAPAPKVAAVREGDVVDIGSLDVMPRPVRPIRPVYPPIAARQKIRATVILSAFIDDKGDVGEIRVLRGDARFGLNEAAIRAIRTTKFTSPMKDGKRVRTWFPQTIEFVPN
jgi:TonB family protein